MTGKAKERVDSSSTQPAEQILTASGRMKEVEVQDSEQVTSSRIKNPFACFHMLWFNSVGIRKRAKKFLKDPSAPHLTCNSL